LASYFCIAIFIALSLQNSVSINSQPGLEFDNLANYGPIEIVLASATLAKILMQEFAFGLLIAHKYFITA
jgi:hypothetical protein